MPIDKVDHHSKQVLLFGSRVRDICPEHLGKRALAAVEVVDHGLAMAIDEPSRRWATRE
jgi:hypothetical protein